ncbi:MAG: hypothetical protein L0322_26000 [Chloroflexi bacterium]|nr:hypothetical protein [Chloroflexota bacterium]
MPARRWVFLAGLGLFALLGLLTPGGRTAAQGGNPTPIIITLSPTPGSQPSATPTASPTAGGAFPPDRFEPNDEPGTAATIGLGAEPDLTLAGQDADYFTGYLKAGQLLRLSTYVYGQLDTRLAVSWAGQLLAENDDRSPADVGSTVAFTAPADGWYLALVEKATVYDGLYDLEALLVEPTATSTPLPTVTPAPTPTPNPTATPLFQPDPAEPNNTPETARPVTPGVRNTYTVGHGDVDYFTFIAKAGNRYACETITAQVDTLLTVNGLGTNDDRGVGRVDSYFEWTAGQEQAVVVRVEARGGTFGPYDFICQNVAPSAAPPRPPGAPAATATPAGGLTLTATITATNQISLTVQHLGRVTPQAAAPLTHIRLLVYYDANNDRQPGPGEGIPNVSVLAVDAQGQRLARVFTNAQGEAIFNLAGAAVARVVVPFVPAWSARVRPGEANPDIVLGLPAVRLPVFLPVQNRLASEEE